MLNRLLANALVRDAAAILALCLFTVAVGMLTAGITDPGAF